MLKSRTDADRELQDLADRTSSADVAELLHACSWRVRVVWWAAKRWNWLHRRVFLQQLGQAVSRCMLHREPAERFYSPTGLMVGLMIATAISDGATWIELRPDEASVFYDPPQGPQEFVPPPAHAIDGICADIQRAVGVSDQPTSSTLTLPNLVLSAPLVFERRDCDNLRRIRVSGWCSQPGPRADAPQKTCPPPSANPPTTPEPEQY